MSEFGISIDGFTPATAIADQAKAAEDGGAATLWIATHLYLRDPVALAATALAATNRIKIALMAMSPYSIHPVYAAMAAATLTELYPGRVVLSLGVGAPGDLAAAGIETPRPLKTLEETITICRGLFAGEAVNYAGEIYRVSERRLEGAPCDVPIVLAASRPRMLELAGRHADGVIISGATSAPFVRWCCEQAGGNAKAYGIVYTRLGGPGDPAVEQLRRTLGFILRGAHHAKNVEYAGVDLEQKALFAAYAAEDWATVDALVTDEVIDAHAAVGSADHVRRRLSAFHDSGLGQVVLGGLTAPEDIRSTLAAIT
jgi:5,10-methylenetetrahydromethanopterin reductase